MWVNLQLGSKLFALGFHGSIGLAFLSLADWVFTSELRLDMLEVIGMRSNSMAL
jgi:hypothetical protein